MTFSNSYTAATPLPSGADGLSTGRRQRASAPSVGVASRVGALPVD